jgi:hypothetical protein
MHVRFEVPPPRESPKPRLSYLMVALLILNRAAADRQEAQRTETFALLQESCAQGDLHAVKSILSTMDHQAVANLINFVPKGNNTLLFRACENGHKEVKAQFLLI